MVNDDNKEKKINPPVNLPVLELQNNGSTDESATSENKVSQTIANTDNAFQSVKSQKQNLEDIFSDTEKKEKPAVFQPIESSEHEEWGISDAEIKVQNKKKLTMLLTIFIAVMVFGVGAYWGFAKILKLISSGTVTTDQGEANETPETAPVDNGQTRQEPEETKVPEEEKDKSEGDAIGNINPDQGLVDEADNDRDGLSNQEEIELGTNVRSVDSDEDGLFDLEEVKIYRTNPLNPDTDSDGFLDGEEVKAGYNPKGEGKLNAIR